MKNPFYNKNSYLQELYKDGEGSFLASGESGGFEPTQQQLDAINSGINSNKVNNFENAANKINTIINDDVKNNDKTWSSEKISNLIDGLAGVVDIDIVTTLPVAPENKTIYFVGPKGTAPNQFYEMKLSLNDVVYEMGTTQIDLTQYYTKNQTNNFLNLKQDKLISGTNIKTLNDQSILGNGNLNITSQVGDIILSGITDENGYFKVNGYAFELPEGAKVIVGCRLTGAPTEVVNSCIFTVLQESRSPYKYTIRLERWDKVVWANLTCTLQVFYM